MTSYYICSRCGGLLPYKEKGFYCKHCYYWHFFGISNLKEVEVRDE